MTGPRPVGRLQRFYGGQPLHLMATIISFAIVLAGIAGWFQADSDARGILTWFVACAVTFDAIMLACAFLFDRLARQAGNRREPAEDVSPRFAAAFVRIPAMLSVLLLAVFAPLIFRADTESLAGITGMRPADYLVRWLLATAAMYAVSASWFALRLRRLAPRRTPVGR